MNLESYICNCCGEQRSDWPALGYSSPIFYAELSKDHKAKCELDEDFCIIYDSDQTQYFIRCTLSQRVNDHCQDLEYGVWVSLSETSFNDYSSNYHNENHEVGYFGRLSNILMGYEDTLSIPTDVYTRTGNSRPEVIPHEDHDNPFVRDYYNGISKEEAERRISEMISVV